jgi:hypothetical protein
VTRLQHDESGHGRGLTAEIAVGNAGGEAGDQVVTWLAFLKRQQLENVVEQCSGGGPRLFLAR